MDHQAQVHILRRPSAPGHLAPDQHHQQPLQPHDQAVNMASQPPVQKVRLSPVSDISSDHVSCQGQLYEMPGGHQHQPHLQHQGPGALSQNSS